MRGCSTEAAAGGHWRACCTRGGAARHASCTKGWRPPRSVLTPPSASCLPACLPAYNNKVRTNCLRDINVSTYMSSGKCQVCPQQSPRLLLPAQLQSVAHAQHPPSRLQSKRLSCTVRHPMLGTIRHTGVGTKGRCFIDAGAAAAMAPKVHLAQVPKQDEEAGQSGAGAR